MWRKRWVMCLGPDLTNNTHEKHTKPQSRKRRKGTDTLDFSPRCLLLIKKSVRPHTHARTRTLKRANRAARHRRAHGRPGDLGMAADERAALEARYRRIRTVLHTVYLGQALQTHKQINRQATRVNCGSKGLLGIMTRLPPSKSPSSDMRLGTYSTVYGGACACCTVYYCGRSKGGGVKPLCLLIVVCRETLCAGCVRACFRAPLFCCTKTLLIFARRHS